MSNIKITMMNPESLVPWEKNPRDNADAIIEVARSIEEFGFNQPILIDQNNRICVGHTRREAALSLGLKKVPVVKREMTEEQFIKYNLADNKTSEIATWDNDQLKEIASELDGDFDIPGFSDEEVDALLFGEDESENAETESEASKSSSKRSSNESVKLVFNCSAKQAIEIDQKLDGIIREQGFENQVEALIFALKNFKGNPKVKRVSRG